jgi:hypothetical protein
LRSGSTSGVATSEAMPLPPLNDRTASGSRSSWPAYSSVSVHPGRCATRCADIASRGSVSWSQSGDVRE